jgi:nitrous oxidase accessory protein
VDEASDTTGTRPGRPGRIALVAVVGLAVVIGLAAAGRRVSGSDVASPAPLARPLQPLLDAAPAGSTLRLEPGLYAGPAVIAKPMALRGRPGAIVDGGGVGTVLSVEADGVTVSGLTLRNSGDRADLVDAGLSLAGSNGVVDGLVIDDCLYGIRLQQANGNVVRRNRITSKAVPEERRGDAVRVWYSTDNLFEANDIVGVRDGFAVEANGNRLVGNSVRGSRYGVQILQSTRTEVVGNRFDGNAVGVMSIFSEDTSIEANFIRSGRDIAGQGVVLKDSSRVRVVDNRLLSNSVAVYLDGSPGDPDDVDLFRGNRIAFSGIAVMLHSDLAGNVFEANDFIGNHAEVAVRGGASASKAVWRGNHWDSWQGFDRDRDGIGDTPFEVWAWADRLWLDLPAAQFFRGAPSLSLIDFAERLTLTSEPRRLMIDRSPRVAPVVTDHAPPTTATAPVATISAR